MAGELWITIFDVEHGACAMLKHSDSSKLAMVDSGHNGTTKWRPSEYIKNTMKRDTLDGLLPVRLTPT